MNWIKKAKKCRFQADVALLLAQSMENVCPTLSTSRFSQHLWLPLTVHRRPISQPLRRQQATPRIIQIDPQQPQPPLLMMASAALTTQKNQMRQKSMPPSRSAISNWTNWWIFCSDNKVGVLWGPNGPNIAHDEGNLNSSGPHIKRDFCYDKIITTETRIVWTQIGSRSVMQKCDKIMNTNLNGQNEMLNDDRMSALLITSLHVLWSLRQLSDVEITKFSECESIGLRVTIDRAHIFCVIGRTFFYLQSVSSRTSKRGPQRSPADAQTSSTSENANRQCTRSPQRTATTTAMTLEIRATTAQVPWSLACWISKSNNGREKEVNK